MLEVETDNLDYFWPFCGTIASSMAYIIVITLYHSCFRGLVGRVSSFSTRRRRFMLIYISLLLALTTCSLFQQIYSISTSLFYPDSPDSVVLNGSWLLEIGMPPLLVFTIWGADGFMIWRCFVLYQNTSIGYRRMAFGLLFLISLMSLSAGVSVFAEALGVIPALLTPSISALSNIFLSLLIVCRLLYHQRYLRRVLGVSHGLVYNRIITICVESCALITFCMSAYIIMFMTGCLGRWVALLLLPHICVISALMIIRRVAQGIESTTTVPPPSGVLHRPVLARVEENIQFANPVSTEVMQEGV